MTAPVVGLDAAWTRPNPGAMWAAGYRFGIFYVSPLRAAGAPNPKDLTAGELQAFERWPGGMPVALVYESTAGRALGGLAAGTADGQVARSRAEGIGYPGDRVMFAAVDTAVVPAAMPAVLDYLRAFGAAWGGPLGVYGSADVIDAAAAGGVGASVLWQTEAWSRNPDGSVRVSAHADLLQRVGHYLPAPGVPVGSWDEDAALHPTVLAIFHGGQEVIPPPAPQRPPAPAPAPAPVPTPARVDVTAWRAVEGDTSAHVEQLQRWGNRVFPAYCRIAPTSPHYGPQTVAFIREYARRSGIPGADGRNVGPRIAAALARDGLTLS